MERSHVEEGVEGKLMQEIQMSCSVVQAWSSCRGQENTHSMLCLSYRSRQEQRLLQ